MQVVVTLDAKDLQQLQLKRTTLFADRATTFVLIAGGGVEDTTGLKLASMKAARLADGNFRQPRHCGLEVV